MKPLIRFQGKWNTVTPRPFESEHQTFDIAWKQLKEAKTPPEAYRDWFEKERQISQFLYQYNGPRNT